MLKYAQLSWAHSERIATVPTLSVAFRSLSTVIGLSKSQTHTVGMLFRRES